MKDEERKNAIWNSTDEHFRRLSDAINKDIIYTNEVSLLIRETRDLLIELHELGMPDYLVEKTNKMDLILHEIDKKFLDITEFPRTMYEIINDL